MVDTYGPLRERVTNSKPASLARAKRNARAFFNSQVSSPHVSLDAGHFEPCLSARKRSPEAVTNVRSSLPAKRELPSIGGGATNSSQYELQRHSMDIKPYGEVRGLVNLPVFAENHAHKLSRSPLNSGSGLLDSIR